MLPEKQFLNVGRDPMQVVSLLKVLPNRYTADVLEELRLGKQALVVCPSFSCASYILGAGSIRSTWDFSGSQAM